MFKIFIIYLFILISLILAQVPTPNEQLASLKSSLNAIVDQYKLEDFYYDTNEFSNNFN